MPWTREKLEAEWIGAPIEALGDRAPAALSAYDCVEKHLGAECLAARHLHSYRHHVGPSNIPALLSRSIAVNASRKSRWAPASKGRLAVSDRSRFVLASFAGTGPSQGSLLRSLQRRGRRLQTSRRD